MNILYIPGYRYPNDLQEPLTSGDLRYSFTLSRALAKLGHSVNVLTRRGAGDPEQSELDGVHIFRYNSELSRIFGTSFDISPSRLKLFKKLQKDADLIICNSPLSLEHSVRVQVPVIYIASGLEDVKNYSLSPKEIVGYAAIKLLRDPMKRRTWKKSHLVNTTARHEDETLRDWGIPQAKIGTISSSIDSNRYRPQPKQARKLKKRLGLEAEDSIILSVSRFTPAKGVAETIQAFDKLNRDHTKLVIIGVHHSHDNTYYARILAAIENAKHKKDIVLLEDIPEHDLPAYYSMADVTSVFSKGYDPLPTVIIESMACGTPVVSTYYKTREQFIEDGKTGMFVKEGDQADWVEKTGKLLDNTKLRDGVAAAGRKYVTEHFDWIDIAKKYMEKYEHERSAPTQKDS
jgi:glycosyltransferase involved in cell wall biosynthesis